MKILLIHGEDVVKSRERLNYLVAQYGDKNWEVINNPRTDELLTDTLFAEKRLYVVEDIKNLEPKFLNDKFDTNIIIWHEGNVNQALLKKLPKNTKVEKYDLPKLIFKFLESFYPGNVSECLTLLNNLIKTEPVEFVLALLARHLRDLYWVKADSKTLNYPVWRANKLKVQSEKFKVEDLKKIINELAEADIRSKTSDIDLTTSLDLIISKHLQ